MLLAICHLFSPCQTFQVPDSSCVFMLGKAAYGFSTEIQVLRARLHGRSTESCIVDEDNSIAVVCSFCGSTVFTVFKATCI